MQFKVSALRVALRCCSSLFIRIWISQVKKVLQLTWHWLAWLGLAWYVHFRAQISPRYFSSHKTGIRFVIIMRINWFNRVSNLRIMKMKMKTTTAASKFVWEQSGFFWCSISFWFLALRLLLLLYIHGKFHWRCKEWSTHFKW